MNAQNLKVGSVIEIEVSFSPDVVEKVQVTINRCSDKYVWFKYSAFNRIARATIDKFPSLYRIVTI